MGQSCMDIGVGGGGGENGETLRYMQIPIRHMTNGKTLVPSPRFEAKKRRYKIWLLQRPPSGLDAILAAGGHKLDRERIISEAQELGLSLESIAPPTTAAATTTTGTNAKVEGGSKGPAADPTEPIGTKAEGMHDYPLKSLPSSESLVVDTNSEPDSAAATAIISGTKAEVQGGSLLKRPCEVFGESSETLQENTKQMVPMLKRKKDPRALLQIQQNQLAPKLKGCTITL